VADSVYQASDLNRRGRAILDDARKGLARVRDTDGLSLVITPESRLGELEDLRAIADWVASYVALEAAVVHGDPDRIPLAALGSWTWLRHLPPADLSEFVNEIRDGLVASCREHSIAPADQVLDEWRETAEALSDPASRETLLAESPAAEDWVDVDRPESASAQLGADGPSAS
jgi:hypothetical protein